MQTKTLTHAFSIKPNPAAPPIRFDARVMDQDGSDPEVIVFPCDADEPAFLHAAKKGYSVPEIMSYYLVQSGFRSIDAAKRELFHFFNDLTGCAVSQT